MRVRKIVQGHYTSLVNGVTYDIKRKSYLFRKGQKTTFDRWHIWQGEIHIKECLSLQAAKDFLATNIDLPDFVVVQRLPKSSLVEYASQTPHS